MTRSTLAQVMQDILEAGFIEECLAACNNFSINEAILSKRDPIRNKFTARYVLNLLTSCTRAFCGGLAGELVILVHGGAILLFFFL